MGSSVRPRMLRGSAEQEGAVQCVVCERWFRSRGGLAVHRCREADEQSASTGAGVQEDVSHGVQCGECGRSFRRPGDLKRHKCAAERAKPVEQQRGAVQCGVCRRWFRSRGGLAVYRCRSSSNS